MPNTYSQIAAWRNSSDAIDRITIAVVSYARFILGEDPGTANHALRVNWAKGAFQNPSSVASGLLSAVATDVTLRDLLETATDQQLQTATEFAINQILIF